jgi:hypothetical protein
MAQYKIKIESRPLFCSADQSSVGELFDGNIKCHFRDTGTYIFKITANGNSDGQALSNTQSDYSTEGVVVNNQAAAGRKYWRHIIQIIPIAGMYGLFFQGYVEKLLATDGLFKYFGVDLNILQRPEIDAEFLFGGQDINDGWTT